MNCSSDISSGATPPKVSVVMSVYNDARHLSETLDSILCQSLTDLELIVIDDGSDDTRVGQILKHYAAADSRITVIEKHNEGLTKALIDGCGYARGRYIARIDVGDIMQPRRLEAQTNVLDKNDQLSMVSVWTSYHSPIWEVLWTSYGKPFKVVSDERTGETNGDISHHGAVMFSRKKYHAAGGYRWQFYYGQDWDLWYRLGKLGGHAVIKEVLYKARVFPESISMTQKVRQERIARLSRLAAHTSSAGELASILKQAADIRPGGYGDHTPVRGSPVAQGNYFIGKLLFDRRAGGCRRYFLQAVKAQPWNLKYLGFYLVSFLSIRRSAGVRT